MHQIADRTPTPIRLDGPWHSYITVIDGFFIDTAAADMQDRILHRHMSSAELDKLRCHNAAGGIFRIV